MKEAERRRHSQGVSSVLKRPLVGINILPNSDSTDLAPYLLASEYEQFFREFIDIVDYFVINFTGPSKEILLDVFLGNKDRLEKLLNKYHSEREFNIGVRAALKEEKIEGIDINQRNLKDYFSGDQINVSFPQILIKVDNSLSKAQINEISKLLKERRLDGIIFEPINLYTAPLPHSERKKENDWLSNFYKQTEGELKILLLNLLV